MKDDLNALENLMQGKKSYWYQILINIVRKELVKENINLGMKYI